MIVFNRRILFLCRPPPPFDMCPMVLQNTHPFLETSRGITSPSQFFHLSLSSTRGRRSPHAWLSCLRLVRTLNRSSPSRQASTVALPSSRFSSPHTPLSFPTGPSSWSHDHHRNLLGPSLTFFEIINILLNFEVMNILWNHEHFLKSLTFFYIFEIMNIF